MIDTLTPAIDSDRGDVPPAIEPIDVSFLKAAHPAGTAVLRPVAAAYGWLGSHVRAMPGARMLLREHFLFFALAAAGFMVAAPRFMLLGRYAVERFVFSM